MQHAEGDSMDLLCAFERCTATAAALVLVVPRSISYISAVPSHILNGASIGNAFRP